MNAVAVSTLPMNVERMEEQLYRVRTADYIHVDIMDGNFVERETFWTDTVECLADTTEIPLDIHLMTERPEEHVTEFVDAGGAVVNFHVEACDDVLDAIEAVQNQGAKAGVAINPETEVAMLDDILPVVDHVLVMSVHPGEGGQSFLDQTIPRIRTITEQADVTIEVDGGIDETTGKRCVEAGADILTSGSYVWGYDEPQLAIDILRNL